ncbi:riboflavin kinase [Octopus bimaculoides]|uniref:Riboflavin kinase n=1 Tax=Octopus bimaculoides TaxID=37653 RepID=A0A0L8FSK6_OCTBM|nr:riboflavin kinase [Octopus bimaculoides]XP_014787317.1 riboflavin kinase [Octopus bimaculoides]|eukprot:XP_014787316.1 PREDICTED: riboflavin kinase-like isoform X1 [Octopus bimaculoides]
MTSTGPENYLPYYAEGNVVKGFGRGSKQLGFPTANHDEEVVSKLPSSMDNGVYYGWANVDKGPVYKMVLSIGWNPYYKNEKKSMETHILHTFKEDFYGHLLKVIIVGYLRPMADFNGLDELIKAIENDIEKASTLLEMPNFLSYKDDNFFGADEQS